MKAELGERIVELYHGREAALAARAEFDRVFRDGGLPDEIPEVFLDAPNGRLWIVQLLADAGLATSRSEARRLLKQNAVTVDDQPIVSEESEIDLSLPGGRLFRVGKRRFARVLAKS
jgi:tyrosyl-tRNA synthetase